MPAVKISEGIIPLETYQKMRVVCGLSPKSKEACEVGLCNSLYSIMLVEGDRVIGMGRIVGDGGCFCQVVDICVIPARQGQGLGKLIMQYITDFIQEELPASCYTSLIADGDASILYEKFGFRDTQPVSKGMYFRNE